MFIQKFPPKLHLPPPPFLHTPIPSINPLHTLPYPQLPPTLSSPQFATPPIPSYSHPYPSPLNTIYDQERLATLRTRRPTGLSRMDNQSLCLVLIVEHLDVLVLALLKYKPNRIETPLVCQYFCIWSWIFYRRQIVNYIELKVYFWRICGTNGTPGPLHLFSD